MQDDNKNTVRVGSQVVPAGRSTPEPNVLPEPTIQLSSPSHPEYDPSRIYDPTRPESHEDLTKPKDIDKALDGRMLKRDKPKEVIVLMGDDGLPLDESIQEALSIDEMQAEKSFSPVAKKEIESPEVPDEAFTPEEPPKSEDDVNWEGILTDAYRERDDHGYVNIDKAPTAVPTGDIGQMNDVLVASISRNPESAIEDIRDMTTDINIIDRARSEISMAHGLLVKAIERIDGDLTEKLSPTIIHAFDDKKVRIQDSAANVSAIHKDKTKVNLNTDKDSSITISALIGANIRKYYLYNSGISINIKRVHLKEFSGYVRSITESDADFGKQFGGFYYLYADLHITKYIVEHLLPLAICGSSFKDWRDFGKLTRAISHQDYHVLLWAIAQTMHPKGIEVGYACGNPECGHVLRDTVDLAKLRYQNLDLINKEMRDIIVGNTEMTPAVLDEYKTATGMGKVIRVTIGSERQMDVELKQASLHDYLQVGTEFYTDLEAVCNTTDAEAVNNYLKYNIYKAYRPWIHSLTIYEGETEYYLENDGSKDSINGMNMFLDELQLHQPDFGDKIAEYIVDTRISHIAFHVNACPNCGTLPTGGRDGFIPYDPQYNFFTLALSLLHRVR